MSRRPFPLALLVLALALPGVAPAAADHGPLPGASSADAAVDAVLANTTALFPLLADFLTYTGQQLENALARVIAAILVDQTIIVPFSTVDNITNRLGEDGAQMIRLLADALIALIQAGGSLAGESFTFGVFLLQVARNKLGLHVAPGEVPPASLAGSPPCVTNVQAALNAALPGQEIRVCAGAYNGPLVVRQHFVSLVAEQGPQATIVNAHGGDGIVVEGSGVTVAGFRVQGADGPGAAGIRVGTPDDSHAGDIVGTLVRDNVLRGNTIGVRVWKSSATILVGNTIRDSTQRNDPSGGVGVLVDEPAGVAAAVLDDAGVVVAGNNLINNAGFAIRSVPGSPSAPGLPTVAALNYYGNPLGANVQLVGSCFGPTAPTGDAACRNGVSTGVVYAGFSPVPL